MNSQPARTVGRLAMREEGMMWNAYYAMPDTMDGALLLGSIAIRLVKGDRQRREVFMELMRGAVAELLEETVGARVAWSSEQPASESERGGNA